MNAHMLNLVYLNIFCIYRVFVPFCLYLYKINFFFAYFHLVCYCACLLHFHIQISIVSSCVCVCLHFDLHRFKFTLLLSLCVSFFPLFFETSHLWMVMLQPKTFIFFDIVYFVYKIYKLNRSLQDGTITNFFDVPSSHLPSYVLTLISLSNMYYMYIFSNLYEKLRYNDHQTIDSISGITKKMRARELLFVVK